MLRRHGLSRYYELAGPQLPPVGPPPREESLAWLEPLQIEAERGEGPVCALELDLQGIHCAACVWLISETFRRQGGGVEITVNPALGKVKLFYRRRQFALDKWIQSVQRFGYRFGPSRKRTSSTLSGLSTRLGLTVALTGNVMLLSISFYFGLSPADGYLYPLFTYLAAALSTAVVLIGGGPFFRTALQCLRSGLLHLDLPIALGMAIVYGVSLAQLAGGAGGDTTYFDTLDVFVTLMLMGRWLQEHVLDRNRRFLLEDDGVAGLFVRRIENDAVRSVAAHRVRSGDTLLVAPGELVAVDSTLVDDDTTVSTDWINGESIPHFVRRGERLRAGCFNATSVAFVAQAQSDFADSPLIPLLRQASVRPLAPSRESRFWDRAARLWVVGVLSIATIGFLLWLDGGTSRALEVAVSILVITCPCAIGLALPLARETIRLRLRGVGFFVRASDLLDRLPRVRKIFFDKTGTLTLGRLELVDKAGLQALSPEAARIGYNLAARSAHPISACISNALSARGNLFDVGLSTREFPGQGVETFVDGEVWRLGRRSWAAPNAHVSLETVLSRNGGVEFAFDIQESARPGTATEVECLQQVGYQLAILSGDTKERVRRFAERMGLARDCALGGLSPQDKAAQVAACRNGESLFLGDGVNDSLAFDEAAVAGTVAIDRPALPAKAHFFLLGEGLGSLREALTEARRLALVSRRILFISSSYNVLAIAVSLAGWMSPLKAALSMPLSSVGILALTLWQLRPQRSLSALPPLQAAEAQS